jgi:galactose mutarotase-like enzyme
VVGERNEDGFAALTLESEALGGIEAIFVPEAGMVCCSLRHRGEELLGQRGGLPEYVESGSTMGIPFLHPWANRLGRSEFEVAGREVDLDLPDLSVKRDAAGLPMHGLLTAARGWKVERHGEVEGGGVLVAGFDFGAYPRLTAAFPFPHRVELEATLLGPMLTIVTTLRNDGEASLPVSFGFHPYLRLPGGERGEWVMGRRSGSASSSTAASCRPTGASRSGSSRARLAHTASTTPTLRRRMARRSCSREAAAGSSWGSARAIASPRSSRPTTATPSPSSR